MTRTSAGTWVMGLDGTRCDGHGICVLHCPDLVTLDEWGFAGVARERIGDRSVLRRARRAAAACPAGALYLRRVGDGAGSESMPVRLDRGTTPCRPLVES